jgi:hypothetical protein
VPTATAGSNYSIQITGKLNAATITLGQRIEFLTAAQTMAVNATTLSFWVYNHSGGTIAPAVLTYYPSTADTWTGVTVKPSLATTNATLISGNADTDATWTYWYCNIPADNHYAAGAAVEINFGSMAATYYVCVSQAQLEIGATGATYTTFEVLPPAVELARCRRFARSTTAASGTSSATGINGYISPAGTTASFFAPFWSCGSESSPMFSNPSMTYGVTITASGTGDVTASTPAGTLVATGAISQASGQPGLFYFAVTGGTANQIAICRCYNSGAASWILFSSDL